MNYTLRKWTAKDRLSLQKHANNPKIAHNLRNSFPYPYTLKDAARFLRYVKDYRNRDFLRAISINGEAVGNIEIHFREDVYSKSAEIGYWIGEEYWGKGILTSAVRDMVDYVFQNTDIVRIYAEVYDYNIASQRVLEKNGFEKEGVLKKSVLKDGEFHDCFLYALIR